jgi:hypothetical protein
MELLNNWYRRSPPCIAWWLYSYSQQVVLASVRDWLRYSVPWLRVDYRGHVRGTTCIWPRAATHTHTHATPSQAKPRRRPVVLHACMQLPSIWISACQMPSVSHFFLKKKEKKRNWLPSHSNAASCRALHHSFLAWECVGSEGKQMRPLVLLSALCWAGLTGRTRPNWYDGLQ